MNALTLKAYQRLFCVAAILAAFTACDSKVEPSDDYSRFGDSSNATNQRLSSDAEGLVFDETSNSSSWNSSSSFGVSTSLLSQSSWEPTAKNGSNSSVSLALAASSKVVTAIEAGSSGKIMVGLPDVISSSVPKVSSNPASTTVISSVKVSASSAAGVPEVAAQTSSDASVWSYCADERQFCAFSGTQIVRYGAEGSYVTAAFTDGVECNNKNFPDPIRFVVKSCFTLSQGAPDANNLNTILSSELDKIVLLGSSLEQQFSTASVDGAIDLVFSEDISKLDFDVVLQAINGSAIPIDVEKVGSLMTILARPYLEHSADYKISVTAAGDTPGLAAGLKSGQDAAVSNGNGKSLEVYFTTQKPPFEGYLASNKKSRKSLLKSEKLVFAHYFTPFPQLINNSLPGEDYYDSEYLNPNGENAKFRAKGGFLRERPLYRAPFYDNSDWKMTDARFQVRQAASIGIDGFAMNILEVDGSHWERILRMYDAAEEVDGFKMLIMPDMNSIFKREPEQFIPAIQKLAARSASYRLKDGRLVVSPYLAESQSPSWWKNTLDELKLKGIKVALVPLYQGWIADFSEFKKQEPAAFEEYIVGVSDWGSRSPSGGYNLINDPKIAHQDGVLWMAPVAPQDSRPKSSVYTEAGNSETFRAMWMSAIDGGADWVQLITWNDYSETSEIAPSSQIGYSFYDLSAYFIDWFKTGTQPSIERDVIYAFYREHSTDAALENGSVQEVHAVDVNGESPRNEIEMLAFLASPAVLEIVVENKSFRKDVKSSGIVSFKVPLIEGRPKFRILRNGAVIKELEGPWSINNSIEVQDLTYHGVTSSRQLMDRNTQHMGWPQKLKAISASKMTTAEKDSPFVRKSNALATEFNFNGKELNDGFTYHFLPLVGAKSTVVSFDINLSEACLSQSILVMRLTGLNRDGAVLELCSAHNGRVNLFNRTRSDRESLDGTVLRPNSWYQIQITAKREGGLYQRYDLKLIRPDETFVYYENLVFENNLDELTEVQFVLEESQASAVTILVDNISAGVN